MDATLQDIVETLDATVVNVVVAADELASPVTDVMFFDRADPRSIHPGAIVLAIGIDAEDGDALGLVDRAGREAAAAVVFKTDRELPPRLMELARSLEVTLLSAPGDVAWGQVYSLMRNATAGGAPLRDLDHAGVPVGDLFALADAIAAAIGAPVTIEDPRSRVLAYANLDQPIDEPRRQTILGRMPPPEWAAKLDEARVMQRLRAGEDVVRFEHPGLATRTVAAVRAGDELVGTVWAADGRTPLEESAQEELVRAARLAAIHLIAHRLSDDVKRRTRGVYVKEILEGRVPAGASGGAWGGLQPAGPYSVVAFQAAPDDADGWSGAPERLLSIVNLYAEGVHREAMCAIADDRIWALIPTPARDAHHRLVEFAGMVVQRIDQTLGAHVVAGIGVPVPAVADIPRSRRAAERALAVLARRPSERVVHIDDVRAHAALLDILDFAAGLDDVLHPGVHTLLERGSGDRNDHIATLRAYLDCHGDAVKAAALLDVHPNTLRYRLRRLTEIAELHLDDADERLMCELELRLQDRAAR